MSIDHAGRAYDTAARFLDKFEDAAAIDTADYEYCSLMIVAAHLILADRALAARVGELMEPPR